MRHRRLTIVIVVVVAVLGASALAFRTYINRRQSGTSGALHEREALLKREVDGLRGVVSRLDRHEFLLPPDDIAIAIDDRLVQQLLAAQLPFDTDSEQFHLTLSTAEVTFRGSPIVRLTGGLSIRDRPALGAAVRVVGALADVEIDGAAGVLIGKLAIDHLDIEDTVGLKSLVPADARDELARRLRHEIVDRLPVLRVPVKIQPELPLPAVTTGAFRLVAGKMPIKMSVSGMVAAGGTLWIGVHAEPGAVTRVAATGGR